MENLSSTLEAQIIVGLLLLYFCHAFTLRCLAALRRSRQARKNGCEPVPSYPHIDPILGLDAVYRSLKAVSRGHVMDEFDKRFKTINGGVNTFSTVLIGSTVVHTMAPENIKTILSTRCKDYNHSPGRKAAFGYFGNGILTADGHDWKVSRAMLRPSFTKTQVRNLHALEEHVQHLIARIPKDGKAIDLQPLFFQFTTDTIFETLLGESAYSLIGTSTETRHTQVVDAVEYTTERAAIRLRIGPLASLFLGPKFWKDLAYINNYVRDYVSRALATQAKKSPAKSEQTSDDEPGESQRYVFLQEIVRTHRDVDRIQAELLHVLGAGRDTTASLLSVMCYTIARRPDVVQKLRQEILQHVGANVPTYKDLRNLKYLRWTIDEG
jgi:cytochrome P450